MYVTAVAKETMRKEIRMQLRRMDLNTKAAEMQRVTAKVLGLREIVRAEMVALYASSGRLQEFQTELLIEHLYASGKRCCFPRVTGLDQITFFEVESLEGVQQMETSVWGIPEPQNHLKHAVYSDEIDAMIMPGLAFDRKGRRLGQGKGCYDQFLHRCTKRPFLIAPAHHVQIVECVPTSKGEDVSMNLVVSPL